MNFTGADFALRWPVHVFLAEAVSQLAGNRLVSSGWSTRVARLLEEAFAGPVPATEFSEAGGLSWGGDTSSQHSYLRDLVEAAQAGTLTVAGSPTAYWPQRKGGRATPVVREANVRRTFVQIIDEFGANGYLDNHFPRVCVDAHDSVAVNESDFLEQHLGVADLWPLTATASEFWDDDTFYGLIEVFHDIVARPRQRGWHDYGGCGWHYSDFAIEPARQLYRWRVNTLLDRSAIPLRLAESGEDVGRLTVVTDEARGDLLERLVSHTTPADASPVQHAIALYRARASSIEDKRSAILALAGVLEKRRPLIRQQLYRRDEDALFEIGNRFAIRHQNESQKSDYDPAFLDWVFWWYAATVELTDRLLARARGT